MRLIRLELCNIGLHRHRAVDFTSSLVGIFGDNGSGKTTLVNSIYAAMTNDFNRFPGSRDQLITDTASPEERSFIELTFEHCGVEYTLRRQLRPEGRLLTYTVHGETIKVREESRIRNLLESVIGFSKSLLDQFMFIDQWKISAFLDSTPAERMQAFHALCNTALSERLWKLVGDSVTADAGMARELVDSSIDQLHALYEAQKGRLSDAKTAYLGCRNVVPSKAVFKRLRKQSYLYSRYMQLRKRIKKREAKLPELKAKLAELRKFRDESTAEYLEFDAAVKASQLRYTRMQSWKTLREQYDAAVSARAEAEREFKTAQSNLYEHLKKEPKAPKDLLDSETILEHRETIGEHRASLKEAKEFLAQLARDGQSVCPTCGSSVPKLVARYKDIAANAPAVIAAMDARVKACEGYRSAMFAFNERKASIKASLDACGEAYHRLPVPEPVEGEYDPTVIKRHEEKETAAAAAFQEKVGYAKDYEQLAATIETKEERLGSLRLKLKKLVKLGAKNWKDSGAELDEHRLNRDRLKTCRSSFRQLKQEVKHTEEQYATAKAALAEQRKRNDVARAWLAHLTVVRDIFHRDSAPLLVASSRLAQLETDINRFLEPFGSPFSVKAGDDLSLTIQLPGHKPRAAEWLSGAQKVILSMSLLLSQSLGLLVLDEPTAGLDESNRNYLRLALRRFQKVARSRGLQIVVITHSMELEGVFGQVIRL